MIDVNILYTVTNRLYVICAYSMSEMFFQFKNYIKTTQKLKSTLYILYNYSCKTKMYILGIRCKFRFKMKITSN